MKQNIKSAVSVTVTHKCNHQRTLAVKGVKLARQYKAWMAIVDCPACQGKTEEMTPIERETVAIDSIEQVLEIDGSYWVSSRLAGRYYRVVVDGEDWQCSSRETTITQRCIEKVQAYRLAQADAA